MSATNLRFALRAMLLIAAVHGTAVSQTLVSLGALRTQAEAAAIRLLAQYTENLTAVRWNGTAEGTSSWLFHFSPEVRIETGEQDAFNGIVAKISGNYALFDITTVPGTEPPVLTPNTAALFHVFPISIAAESDRGFTSLNALVEAGYVPWYQNQQTLPEFIRRTKVGLFVQGGYKFRIDSATTPGSGDAGDGDQSSEAQEDPLFRIKGSVVVSPEVMLTETLGLGIIGAADGWYDFVNRTTYFRLEGTLRIILQPGQHLDFTYEKGSGAPNFNRGEQFSANITVQM